jgi:hypothetical protein
MTTAAVDKLNAEHPHVSDYREFWIASDLLYRGGKAMQDNATRFLLKRPKEVNDVYLQRVMRFTYDNIVGPAIGWYQSKLFNKDPDIELRTKAKVGEAAKLSDAKLGFYKDWLQNCDRNGMTYVDFWRQVYLSLMLFKEAWCCIDLPGSDPAAQTLYDVKTKGLLNPYAMLYDPRHVINYSVDKFGALEWVVIKVFSTRQDFLEKSENVERWYYYDREKYRIFERAKETTTPGTQTVALVGPDGQTVISDGGSTATLIDEGPHALSRVKRVPVRRFWIPDGLWLMQRAFLPAIRHINLVNSYYWGLEMANLAMPVIKTDDWDFQQTISETASINLRPGDTFEWTEPRGTSFEHSAKAIEAGREEIYRQMYLMAQGRSSSASASSSSGYSKEMDMMPSKDVLGQYGDIVRAGMQLLGQDVSLAHGDDDVEWDVHGFTLSTDTAAQMIELMEFAEDAEIQSDTWFQEIETRTALACIPDANRSMIDVVVGEIQNGPKKSERLAQQQEAQKLQFTNQLQRAGGAIDKRVEQAA